MAFSAHFRLLQPALQLTQGGEAPAQLLLRDPAVRADVAEEAAQRVPVRPDLPNGPVATRFHPFQGRFRPFRGRFPSFSVGFPSISLRFSSIFHENPRFRPRRLEAEEVQHRLVREAFGVSEVEERQELQVIQLLRAGAVRGP